MLILASKKLTKNINTLIFPNGKTCQNNVRVIKNRGFASLLSDLKGHQKTSLKQPKIHPKNDAKTMQSPPAKKACKKDAQNSKIGTKRAPKKQCKINKTPDRKMYQKTASTQTHTNTIQTNIYKRLSLINT